MARQTGSNFVLSIIADGGTVVPVGHASTVTYSGSISMEDVTTIASGGTQEVIPGRESLTISVDGFQDYEAITGTTNNALGIEALYRGKTLIDWSLETPGGDTLSGEGYINDLTLSIEADIAAGFSFTITRTGATAFTARA